MYKCLQCNKEVNKSGAKFCSQDCYHENKKKTHIVVRLCPTCGKKMKARTSYELKRKKFCSRKCRKHTSETKEKIRKTKTGQKVHSEKWKRKQSLRMKGNKYRLGHPLSSEHKAKMIQRGESHWAWKDGRCSDPEYIKWQKRHNQHLKRCAKGSYSKDEWLLKKKEFGNKCRYCGFEGSLSVDHIIPLSRGGTNYIENIQPLCLPCNMKKHAKLPKELSLKNRSLV